MAEANSKDDVVPGRMRDNMKYENLALEGGGAKGLAYLGVLKVLRDKGILSNIHRFAGTSAGALAATLLALGFGLEAVREHLSDDLEEIVMDAQCGGCSFLPNCLMHYGWNPGKRLHWWIGERIKEKTGSATTTFMQLYKFNKHELCIPVTNINNLTIVYCHPKTTPDMPISIAVRMSVSIPGVFQPVKYKMYNHIDYYVDGALLCNYPIRCFDGHWLDMERTDFRGLHQNENKSRSFLEISERRFMGYNEKTLGVLVYTEKGAEAFKTVFDDRADPIDYRKSLRKRLERFLMKNKVEHSVIENGVDSDDESESVNNIMDDSVGLLTNEETQDLLAQLDSDVSNIPYANFMEFLQRAGVNPWQLFLNYPRQNITSLKTYSRAIWETLLLCTKAVHTEDIKRTIGINTGVVDSLSFTLDEAEKDHMFKRGETAANNFFRWKEQNPDMQ